MMKSEEKKDSRSNHQFVVTLEELRRGSVSLDRDVGLADLQDRLSYCEYETTPESAHVRVNLETCGDGVLVQGHVDACIRAQCGTCLANANLRLSSKVSVYLSPKLDEIEMSSDEELTPDDLKTEWYEGETIFLDNLIYDAIILELPMNPKCGESCAGLPAAINTLSRQEIDPRLAPLAKFRLEKER
ncbi:MAG: DUF177 domain-containing protein [Deltaproteobacteria bacterium]|nr:DUF177 domain-containing protein [Deltaproteobacteria bacterium]